MTNFEAFLLVKMRAKNRVSALLERERVTQEELVARSSLAADVWGLNRPGYSADIYNEAIGEPVSERHLTSDETDPVFARSICRLYQLASWPNVLFRVNQHPSGYAWGEQFVQHATVTILPSLYAIEPWEWVAETIEAVASQVEVLDHWNHQKDLRLSFSTSVNRQVFIAKFDFELLQEWIREEPEKRRKR